MKPLSLFRLALALFPSLASAQATVFRSATLGGEGNVCVFPALGQAPVLPPELQGITLLPIDATGLTKFTQFQPDQPRRKSDVPGASRLVLPGGRGALYRFRRTVPGGTEFGFFVVHSNGTASFLASFPGSGLGHFDPIPNPVGVSADGSAFLVATTPDAGGDVFEVSVDTATIRNVTPGLPPLVVLPQGLVLLPEWGAALTSSGPLRFARGTSMPLIVPLRPKVRAGSLGHNPPGTPNAPLTYFGNGMAASGDGSTVAVIAGTSPTSAHVFTFRLAGPSVCVNDNPAEIPDPGFGTNAGPLLALSPDGSRAAWKEIVHTAQDTSGEIFTRRVPFQPTPPEYQITADSNFTDTLNDTGVIAFFDRDKVVQLVGEANGAGGIEKGDFYQAAFPAGGGAPVLTNLSNTSGDTTAPFDFKGDIESSDGIYQIPGKTGSVYFVPGRSGRGSIYRLDGASGTSTLLYGDVASIDFVESVSSSFVFGLLREQPSQRELVKIPFDHASPATALGAFPASTTFGAHGGSTAGTFVAVVSVTGGEQLLQIFVPTGNGALWPDVLNYGPLVGFDGSGRALASVHLSSQSFFAAWALGSNGSLYGAGPSQSIVLPGN